MLLANGRDELDDCSSVRAPRVEDSGDHSLLNFEPCERKGGGDELVDTNAQPSMYVHSTKRTLYTSSSILFGKYTHSD